MVQPLRPDRRVERTRRSLLTAFSSLLLERGYDGLSVGEIVARADVGRSTFYEQFENKEELLRATLAPLFTILATAGLNADLTRLEVMLRHLLEQRRLTRALLNGSARQLSSALLAGSIEERLCARIASGAVPLLPPELIAAHVAEGQLALIDTWLAGDGACGPAKIAGALAASARACTSALLQPAVPRSQGSGRSEAAGASGA